MNKKNSLVGLSDFAKELGVPKSRFSFYKKLGLLIPVGRAGKTDLFDREETLRILEIINKHQHEGKTLNEISSIIRDSANRT